MEGECCREKKRQRNITLQYLTYMYIEAVITKAHHGNLVSFSLRVSSVLRQGKRNVVRLNEWFGAIVHGYLVCLSFERPNADTVYCCHNVTILNMQK